MRLLLSLSTSSLIPSTIYFLPFPLRFYSNHQSLHLANILHQSPLPIASFTLPKFPTSSPFHPIRNSLLISWSGEQLTTCITEKNPAIFGSSSSSRGSVHQGSYGDINSSRRGRLHQLGRLTAPSCVKEYFGCNRHQLKLHRPVGGSTLHSPLTLVSKRSLASSS